MYTYINEDLSPQQAVGPFGAQKHRACVFCILMGDQTSYKKAPIYITISEKFRRPQKTIDWPGK